MVGSSMLIGDVTGFCPPLVLLSPAYRWANVGLFRKTAESKKAGRNSLQEILMSTKVYIGNLSYEADNMTLDEMFKPHGTVVSAQVIMDRDSGRSKGFGFVEMSTPQEAQAAIAALNGKEINGRALNVNEAKPRVERTRGGRSGGRGGRY
jgi:cold-inducible RNA-binding protein